jgi:hypothetical protein
VRGHGFNSGPRQSINQQPSPNVGERGAVRRTSGRARQPARLPARVIARWLPNQEVRWRANFAEPGHWPWNDDTRCRFRLKSRGAYAGQEVVGHISRQDVASASGWMDGGAVVGNTEAITPEVSTRWINLGNVGGDGWLEAVALDGTRRSWTGRQSWRLGEWIMTVDARPDLREVTGTLKDTGKHAVTHLAVVRRLDARPLTAAECMPVLTAYQLASSFVLGRFTSPALAEARDDGGRLMWREWSVRLADQLGGVTSWWSSTAAPIADPLRLLGEWLLDTKRQRVAEYLAQAYVASNRGGFVEQRLTTAFAALELLSCATHWSTRSMARARGMSQTASSRIWRAFGRKPHLVQTWKLSSDPQFIDKVRDLCGLYLNPPEAAVVLCVDEQSQIQALERTAPALPLMPASPQRRSHDDTGHGTTNLYAGLNLASGLVISQLTPGHRAIEFRRLLDGVDRAVPAELDLQVSCDNSSTHKTPAIRRWLLRPPPLPAALHADLQLVVEPGRAVVRRVDQQVAAAWQPPVGPRVDPLDPVLDRHLEPAAPSVCVDQDRRRDPRQDHPISPTNLQLGTLAGQYRRPDLRGRRASTS